MDRGSAVATGTLTALWRSVYRKAADAAELRVQALLGDHVQQRHGRRAVAVVLDGGGATLTVGAKCDLELPWAFQLEGWALYATASGSLALDLEASASYTAFPADLTSICGTGTPTPPALTAAAKARSDDLTGWTPTALPRGAVLRVLVDSASGISLATLTLFVRAL